MGIQALLGIATLPAIFLMIFFYKKDLHEPEPEAKVRKVFFAGMVSVIPILIVELFVSVFFVDGFEEGGLENAFLGAFLVAATVEEVFKFLAVRMTVYKDPDLNEPYDGIVYCVAASLGFALVENLMFVLSSGFATGLLRAITAIPAHALFGVFMGYFVGKAKFLQSEGETRSILTGLLLAIFCHGLYDFVLLYEGIPYLALSIVPMLGFFWALGIWKVNKLVAISPFKKVIESTG